MSSRPPRIGYPSGWTLAVVDEPTAAASAAGALRAWGLADRSVVVVDGPDAPERLRRLGASSSPLAGLRRAIQFMTMDQLPDLYVYEAAVREGRPVVGAKVGSDRRAEVVAILREHGAHFVNSFGAWMTSEIVPWRGRMPDIPQYMQR